MRSSVRKHVTNPPAKDISAQPTRWSLQTVRRRSHGARWSVKFEPPWNEIHTSKPPSKRGAGAGFLLSGWGFAEGSLKMLQAKKLLASDSLPLEPSALICSGTAVYRTRRSVKC